jgi:Mg-chelatase subunit ChlD
MATHKTLSWIAAGLLLGATVAHAGEKEQRRTVDLVICLDTSGSMKGLLDSARRKIWTIVNDLALAKPTPRLRVALLTFGNHGNDEAAGWVRVESGLTEDLDLISKRLFALTTNGGTEYVGRVMRTGLEKIQWQEDTNALKLMVVAGNESADQDKAVSFREMARKAIARGIMVNSIYCGNPADNIAPGWQEIAKLSDGHFAAIDQNRGTVNIATPFDTKLAALSASLNKTYIPFGDGGERGKNAQSAEDKNAIGAGSAAGRARSKSTKLYYCSWCLVDATRNNAVKLAEIKDADLPKELQGLTLEKKREYLDQTFAKRAEIQKEIAELHVKRQKFVNDELAKRGDDDAQAFDRAVRDALRAQAIQKGYKFEE